MCEKKPPVASWEIMQAMKAAIGASGMQNIFSVGQTQIGRYCRNPEFTADSERNPFDRIRLLLRQADEAGASEAVRAALDFIMEPLGLRVAFVEDAEPDQPTTIEEMLSDYKNVGLAHKAMKEEKAHPNVVRPIVDEAKQDLEQTYTSYKRDWEAGKVQR